MKNLYKSDFNIWLETPIAEYYQNLRDAFDAREEVDMFDLDSNDINSTIMFEHLCIEDYALQRQLIKHIIDNADELMEYFNAK